MSRRERLTPAEFLRYFAQKWKYNRLVKKIERANKEIMNILFQHVEAHLPNDLIQGYKFVTAVDDMVCDRCAVMHGMTFPFTDDAHRPPIHPNCRCWTEPTILDILTMQTIDLGGVITINHNKAFDLEYGALTEDGGQISWDVATGYLKRAIDRSAEQIGDKLKETILDFFK